MEAENGRLFNKKKRKRTIITDFDLEKLEELFSEDKWPDRRRKEQLAKSIRKTENFVNTWFQNRRAKLRRLSRQETQQNDILDDINTDSDQSGVKLAYGDVDGSKCDKQGVGNGQRSKSKDFIKNPKHSLTSCRKERKKDDLDPANQVSKDNGQLFSGLSWRYIFQRIVHMVAASEEVIQRSNPSYTDAIRDAALGIRIKDYRLIYSKEYGLLVLEWTVAELTVPDHPANYHAATRHQYPNMILTFGQPLLALCPKC